MKNYLSKQITLDSGGVEINPTTINSLSVLKIYAIIQTTIPSGGSIQITFPQGITAASTACSFTSPSSVTAVCSYSDTTLNLKKLTARVSSNVKDYFELNVQNFQNPSTTAKTSSFIIETYDSSGSILDTQRSFIILQATPASLQSLTLASSSLRVGDSGQELTVSFQTKNIIPSQGKIYVLFPYWNPEASGTQYTLQSYIANTQSVQCEGLSGAIVSNPTCTFDSDTQTLQLTNGFSSQVAAGSSISFKIKNFKNPITTQTVSGFIVSTGDAITGFIDQLSGSMKMSSVGVITTSSVKVDNSTVQEQTKYRIEFLVPIPLSQGCILEIQFPSQITIDSSILSSVQAFGLPNTQRTLSGSIDRQKNSYLIQSACPTYRDNANSAIIYFTNIRNPSYTMTSSPIEIYLSDQNGQMLVSTNGQGPAMTSDAGNILISSNLTSDNTEINNLATMTFTIQPLHTSEANSQIIIRLPENELSIPSGSCSVTSIQALSSNANCQVQDSGQTIVITQAFTITYTSKVIQFKISQIKLPPSTATIGNIQVEFYTFSSGSFHLVDSGSASGLFQATKGYLLAGIVESDSLHANDVTTYTVSFRIKNSILQNGYIVITLPSQLKIPTITDARCQDFSGFPNTPTCMFTSSSVTIRNGFSSSSFPDQNTILSVRIFGIQNPRSLSTTSSFTIQTFSSTDNLIDVKDDQMTVTMNDTNSIVAAAATPQTYIVGANTTYTFRFSSPTQLVNGDQLLIQFPPQLNLPLSNTLSSCSGSTNMATSLTCALNGPYGIKLPLSFTKSPLAANTQFAFTVKNVANPSTTGITSLFQAEIQDSQSFQISKNNINLASFKVQMVQGAEFKVISVSHQSAKPFQMTAFEFTFRLENPMPPNAQVKITYPDQITVDESYFACTVSTFGATPQCILDTTAQTIIVKQATNLQLTAGTTYTVTVQGLINSKKAAATDSFQVQTMTTDGFGINYAYKGLTVTSDCDYPCFTCESTSQPSKCLTCDLQSVYNLFLNSQCLTSCPIGYYSGNYQCQKCDKSCAQCANGPLECTKCAAGLYLEGKACVTKCSSSQFIQDSKGGICQPCSIPCGSCSGNVNTCTSCLQNIQNRLFYQGQCYSTCPAGTVEENGSCVQCDSNCKTCFTNRKTCDSCNSGLKWNQLDMNCVTSCPSGLTIDTGTTCEYCDPTCKTCDIKNPKKCLSCYSGLSFYDSTNQCLSQCPQGTAQVTSNDGSLSCQGCSYGCTTCQNSPSYCTKCDDSKSYLFYQFTCVKDSCPSGYTRLSKERNICIRDGERCPYGYDFNDYGECILVAQVCEEGYILNHDKTKCIPVPGAYVPLIFLIASGAWTLFIVLKYRKLYAPIQIITQLLVVYTTLQTISYFTMVALAIALDYLMVKAIHIIAFVSMFLANIAFTLFFDIKLRKEDAAFKHWQKAHKKTYLTFKFTMSIFSFKSARGLYSQLFTEGHKVHRPYLNAAFEDKYGTIVKPLFIVTVVNFMTQVVPILVMDIYNFMFVPWGYQIMVMSIDNLIMGIAIFILEIIEFRHYKKLAIVDGHIFRQTQSQFLAPHHLEDHNVMSGIENDNSMVALNKAMINGPPMQGLGESSLMYNEGRKSKLWKSEKQKSEKEVLERLVKQLVEGQKFNKIFDDDDEDEFHDDYSYSGEYDDIEKMKLPKRRVSTTEETNNLLNKKGKPFEEAREKVENRLSFRVNNNQGNKLLKSALHLKIQNDLQAPLFNNLNNSEIIGGNQTLDLTGYNQLQQITEKRDNMESARTEKYQYQSPQKRDNKLNQSKESLKDLSLPDNVGFEVKSELHIGLGLHVIDFDSPRKNQEEFSKFKEEFTSKIKQRDIELRRNVRDCHSCDDNIMREWYDDLGPESDFDADAISNDSFPNSPKKLNDAEYLARLELFRELMKSKYQYNNCYTHINDPFNRKLYNLSKSKNVTRRTQTYEKDIAIGYDPFAKDENYLYLLDDDFLAELDPRYTNGLISNIIANVSEEDSFIELKKDTQPDEGNNDAPADSDDTDFDFEKMKRSKKRKRDVQFDLDDILGMFDIDDFGNIMLNHESMRDNLNRRVNKNGYLVDHDKNIINQDGDIIFEANELDEEEEIPMPYRFEKRKKQLLKQEEKFINEIQTEKNFDLESILQGEEDKIEEEFQKLKDISRPSSMDSMMGDLPVKFNKNSMDNLGGMDQDDPNKSQPLLDFDADEVNKGDNSANQREKELAKAYGGKPPKAKKKKTKKRKVDNQGSGDKMPTDRMYPFLQQEEDRVKRMAMISYGIDNSMKATEHIRNNSSKIAQQTTQEVKDFEQFFKEQMQDIQQYRQGAKEELNQQIQQNTIEDINGQNTHPLQNIDFYQGPGEQNSTGLQRLDSATTDKTFQQQNNWIQPVALSPHHQQDDSLISGANDPMQELIQQDAERANRFFQKIQRSKVNQSAMNNYSQSSAAVTQYYQRLNQTATSNMNLVNNNNINQPLSALSMSSIPPAHQNQQHLYMIDDQSSQHNNNQDSSFQAQQYQQPQPIRQKFDFYLPTSAANQQQAKLKKNLQKDKEKKDISFSNIGRMQLHGGVAQEKGKIKGLEKVYLQKYPVAPKPNTIANGGDQRVLLNSQIANKRRMPGGSGQFRANTINEQPEQLYNRNNQNSFYPEIQSQNFQFVNDFEGDSGQRLGMINQDLVEYGANMNNSLEAIDEQVTNKNNNQKQNSGWI